MKLRFSLFLFFFYIFISASAQTPDSLFIQQGDTLETIISDTSIIYVIKVAPVTIREKVEIVKPKEKKKFYLSMNASVFQFSENRKAKTGYEDYIAKINAATTSSRGYSLGASIWQCPKRIYLGISANFIRLNQTLHYTYETGQQVAFDNHYNYMNGGVQLGYWFRKDKKISFITYGSMYLDYMLSYSRYTLAVDDPSFLRNFRTAVSYRKYLIDFTFNIKCLVNMRNVLLEVEPYVSLSPVSVTNDSAPYTLTRSYVGLKLGVSHKLF